MRVALISKNKLRFIDGTFVQPAQGHLLHDPWLRCNNMVLSWLQRSISENIAQSILWIDQAHAVWKNLETRFAQGDIFKVSDLQDDLSNLHQGTLDVSTYFTKLTSIWEQIDSLRPTRDCTCAIPCTCGAATDLRKYKDQDRVLKFLKGLTDSFATVRSQIFLLEPIPSLEKTFSMVLGQERRSHVPLSDSTDISSMAMAFHPTTAFGGASSRGRGRTSPGRCNFPPRTCTHCGRHNHTVDTCFMKHGYPPGYHYKSPKPSINHAAESSSSDHTITSPPEQSLASIQHQYNQILQLLQQHQISPAPIPDGCPQDGATLPNVNSITTSKDEKLNEDDWFS
ncbi:uncharacterized protein LOC131647643 [Vicia villosa]|uniref:uncharacterized protein LOC131647643 n=1 Tax=Vicia villosa TaxID=3911 RepID=UPI00273B36AD|nr:uncharacterized protein LOC131647643 [Vicia villosa]